MIGEKFKTQTHSMFALAPGRHVFSTFFLSLSATCMHGDMSTTSTDEEGQSAPGLGVDEVDNTTED